MTARSVVVARRYLCRKRHSPSRLIVANCADFALDGALYPARDRDARNLRSTSLATDEILQRLRVGSLHHSIDLKKPARKELHTSRCAFIRRVMSTRRDISIIATAAKQLAMRPLSCARFSLPEHGFVRNLQGGDGGSTG
jgi:hypothetical protein